MQSPNRPMFVLVAFTLLGTLVTLAVGCGKSQSVQTNSTSGPQSVTLLLDWKAEPEFGGFYAAQVGGNFAKHGITAHITAGGAAAPTWEMVANNKVDFATAAADEVVIARSQKADVVALFAVYQTSPQGVMVHKARGFTSLADVFTSPGTLETDPDPSWRKFCMEHYSPVKVKIIPDTDSETFFLSRPDDSQQCFITSEPLTAVAEAKKAGATADPQTFLIADSGFNPYTTVLIATGETVRNKPQLVKQMVAACREGWQAYLDNPGAANAAMEGINHDMDAATFAKAAEIQKPLIETADTKADGLGSMTSARWNTLVHQLFELDRIKQTVPADECFVNPGK